MSIQEYEHPKDRDRLVIPSGHLSDEVIALIAQAEVPAEHAHLDDELEDWQQ